MSVQPARFFLALPIGVMGLMITSALELLTAPDPGPEGLIRSARIRVVQYTPRLQRHVINIAPDPILAGLERLDNRMLGGVEMFGGMFVNRIVATAHMAADQADAQMNPPAAHLQTLFTAHRTGRDLTNLIKVRARYVIHH